MIYCLVRTRGPNWRLVDADGSKVGSCSRSRLRWDAGPAAGARAVGHLKRTGISCWQLLG
jgi:hypothetical protein